MASVRHLLSVTEEIFLLVDEGGVVVGSEGATSTVFASYRDVLGKDFVSLVCSDDHALVRSAFADCLASPNRVRRVRARIERNGPQSVEFELDFHNALADEQLKAVVVRLAPTTKRQDAAYEALVAASQQALLSVSTSGELRFASPSFLDMMGLSESQVVGRQIGELIHAYPQPEESKGTTDAEHCKVLRPGRHEARLRRADDSVRWALVNTTRTFDENQNHSGWLCALTDITEQKNVELERARKEKQFRGLVEALPDGILTVDLRGSISFLNSQASVLFRCEPRDLLGKAFATLFSSQDTRRIERYLSEMATSRDALGGVETLSEVTAVRADGSSFPAEVILNPVLNQMGQEFIAIVRDLTKRKRNEGEIRRLAAFPRQNPNPVMELDRSGRILYANPAALSLAEKLGVNVASLLPTEHSSLVQACLNGSRSGTHVESATADHIFKWTYYPVDSSEVIHLYGDDITSRRKAEERLKYDALHDGETGLPNRVLFNELVERAIMRMSQSTDESFGYSVLLLDLDRFKLINDSLGHAPGNELLVMFAERLRKLTSPDVTAARFGGDEFALLVEHSDTRRAVELAQTIEEMLGEPFEVAGEEVYVTASVGVVQGKPQWVDAEQVIARAERAMYRAKARGRAQYVISDAATERQSRRLLSLQTGIRKGIDNREFILYYQPIVSLETGLIEGFESLLRWKHPKRGLVPPSEFVPLAEDTGLILNLGRWVLEETCRQNKEWQDEGLRPVPASVNLSTRQFQQEDLAATVEGILETTGLDPKFLKLEITETTAAMHVGAVIETLKRLKASGVKVLIDDFGTGYSSLSYLQRFPIDLLKIDRSFVERVAEDHESAGLVRAIIAMAHNLGIAVVAEGVENEAQLDLLYQERADFIQGFYFSPPVPADKFADLLRNDECLKFRLSRGHPNHR